MNLDTTRWKEYRLKDLFTEIYKAKANVKAELECFDRHSGQTVCFVSRTGMDNGCDCYVAGQDLEGVEAGNALVIGDTTATVSYHAEDFACGDHIVICRAEWLNTYTGLFLAAILRKEKYRYSYGRAFKMELIKNTAVKLPEGPDGTPDWDYIENYIKSLNHKPLTTGNHSGASVLDVGRWECFCLNDLFEIRKGKRLTAADQTEGDTPYVGAIESNNGIANHIGQAAIHEGNTISLSYNGSVGEAFYQPDPFWATDDVNVLYFRGSNGVDFNEYIALFICAVLRQEQFKFSYGRKWTLENMRATKIKLPAKDGRPDWEFMKGYIQSLPYGDRISLH